MELIAEARTDNRLAEYRKLMEDAKKVHRYAVARYYEEVKKSTQPTKENP